MKKPNRKKKNLGRWMSIEMSIVMFVAMLIAVAIYALLGALEVVNTDSISALGILVSIIVACNIGGAAVANVFANKYSAPISEAIDAVGRLSQGDYSVRLDSKKDIPQMRQLKEAINKTASELGCTEVMRTDFIDTVSHEYKTPVASILGYAGMLKSTELTAQQKEYVDVIIDESRHLASMTNSVLLLSKFENMEIVSGKTWFSLDEQIRKSFQFLQHDWLEKDITISGEFNGVMYYGNEDLLSHVWTNIIKNAIKYTERGGDIQCIVTEAANEVRVTIRDNGAGMDEETQKRIFDKFYQKDASRHLEGNGLGLAIVKRAVELCSGRIEVKSEPDNGTEFTVILPNERPEAEEK